MRTQAMNLEPQASHSRPPQDILSTTHPHAEYQQSAAASPGPGAPADHSAHADDGSAIAPGLRALLEERAEATGLEVDDESSDYEDGEDSPARSVFAMSLYPGVQPAYQVDRPYENGHDSATIDSARTLYAEDFDFVVENGRQYCGDYFLPIDQEEQTRQYAIHETYLRLFNLELTSVPLEEPRYILDIGTGIGEWAIGMAEKFPQCEVFGTDIAPIQPTHQVPFNVEFHIENAEDEWIRPADTVDLVHIRNLEGAFSDWSFIYSQAFACIRPGGWIEVLDWEDFFADQNYLSFFPEGSAPHVLVRAVVEAAELAGKPRDARHMDRQLLLDAGFADIQETVYDMGIGPRENSNYGKFWLFSIVTGFEATCLRLLTKHLGWDADEVRELCREVALETKAVADDPERADAFVVKLRVLVGRKPVGPRTHGENGDAGDRSGDESTIGGRTIRSEETA